MKKFLIIALFSSFFMGCSKQPDEKLLKIISDATEKMQEAKSLEEANKVNEDFVAAVSEFEKDNKNAYDEIEKDAKKKAAVQAAGQNYTKVMVEKCLELGSKNQLAK